MADTDVRWLQRAVAITNERALSELADQGVSGISGSRDAVREAVVRGVSNAKACWQAEPGNDEHFQFTKRSL